MGPVIVLLEFAVIAPVAHEIAFHIIRNYTHDRFPVPVVISIVTVCCVCPVASGVATLLVRHVTENFVPVWLAALRMNFPVALCWQLLVAGPLVRYGFCVCHYRFILYHAQGAGQCGRHLQSDQCCPEHRAGFNGYEYRCFKCLSGKGQGF